jgi:hypothetical protein
LSIEEFDQLTEGQQWIKIIEAMHEAKLLLNEMRPVVGS